MIFCQTRSRLFIVFYLNINIIFSDSAFGNMTSKKRFKSTICTNFVLSSKKINQILKPNEKLSTFENDEKGGKVSYQRSYPHYPHSFPPIFMVYIVKSKTYVLYKSDKIPFTQKNVKIRLTLLKSKYRENYLNNQTLRTGRQLINGISLGRKLFFIFRHNISLIHRGIMMKIPGTIQKCPAGILYAL